MSAILQGNVGLGGGLAANIVVRFFTPNTQTEIFKGCAPTDGSGDFTVYGCPVGTYDVGVKSGGCLSILKEDEVFTEGNITNINFGTFKRGDLNGDEWVTSPDKTILYANWGQSGDCYGYAGNWLMPQCPSPPPPGGACYGYVIS